MGLLDRRMGKPIRPASAGTRGGFCAYSKPLFSNIKIRMKIEKPEQKSVGMSFKEGFGLLIFLAGLGFIFGGGLGAFIGGCFAYVAWWLRDINDRQMLDEMKEKEKI